MNRDIRQESAKLFFLKKITDLIRLGEQDINTIK